MTPVVAVFNEKNFRPNDILNQSLPKKKPSKMITTDNEHGFELQQNFDTFKPQQVQKLPQNS